MMQTTLPGKLCWAGFDSNGIEWMVRHVVRDQSYTVRDVWHLYQGRQLFGRYLSPTAAMDMYTKNGAK